MNFLDKTGLAHFWSKIKNYIENKKYISSSDGSITNIVNITYEEYKALENSGKLDADTEYHIVDAQSTIDDLQATLDSLQEQINNVRTKINTLTSKSSGGYVFTTGDGVTEIGKYIDFHSDFTTGNDYDTRLCSEGNNRNTVKLPSGSGTLALTSQIPKVCTILWSGNAFKGSTITVDVSGYSLIGLIIRCANPIQGSTYVNSQVHWFWNNGETGLIGNIVKTMANIIVQYEIQRRTSNSFYIDYVAYANQTNLNAWTVLENGAQSFVVAGVIGIKI